MGGFLLAWARGATLDPALASHCRPALARRGPLGIATQAGPDFVAVHAHSEEGTTDELPRVDGDWVIVGDFRIDDRHRLRARLRDAGAEPSAGASDARLLAAALAAWGHGVGERLLGDYAFAALDRRAARMLAGRGSFGLRGLFYAETREFVACSNDLDALCALPGVGDAPDEAALTEFLRNGGPVHVERTARRHVRRVPAAESRTWASDGGSRRIRHDRLPAPPRIRLVSDNEYVASFREVLDEAVADRLRDAPAAILMSGGLDSPALAASAARARPGALRLALTISTHPLAEDDEPGLARAVATRLGVPHEVMPAEPDIALAHCDDPRLATPEPVDAPQYVLWRRQVARLAAAAGTSLHGEDGDAVLAPPDLLTMLRTIPFPALARDWFAYRMAHGASPWSGLRSAFRDVLGGPRRRRMREADAWAAPSWVRRDLVRRHGEGPPPRAPRHRTRPQAAAALRSSDWESFLTMLDPATSGAAHRFALPFLDLRVIAFVFSIPPIPWAQRKWLLRRSFRDALPESVLARPKSPMRGFREALVRRWREIGGAERALPIPMDHWVDERAWRQVLRESADAERVMDAWRVFELARWLSQPAARP